VGVTLIEAILRAGIKLKRVITDLLAILVAFLICNRLFFDMLAGCDGLATKQLARTLSMLYLEHETLSLVFLTEFLTFNLDLEGFRCAAHMKPSSRIQR